MGLWDQRAGGSGSLKKGAVEVSRYGSTQEFSTRDWVRMSVNNAPAPPFTTFMDSPNLGYQS